ncbi:Poly [ADP-ribose] polymerase 14 [Oryzias melastigma]|uniref:Poly [ADP-ribose] polymerase n=1 Tax=Oryzias melastigma TaxID=30732 RepID=A0A834C0U8_ORYME|nr:Poly [ADP-ribose] polymerase 14 [Oryzias melastigma]
MKDEVEQLLASLSCSAQLQKEEGMVLVRHLVQPGTAGQLGDWKSEVDKIFEGYLCHYETDPYKMKALLKSIRSEEAADKVRVYSLVGAVVLVGKCAEVNRRLADLDISQGKRQGSLSSEAQTIVRRLGEAKVRLLLKDIKGGVGKDFPEVKVTPGEAGQLRLSGSVEEILKVDQMISDKEDLVLERVVSNKSPQFLNYLRENYGAPGVLGDSVGLDEGVEVEIRDTELHFFSLSADKLEKSADKIEKHFSDIKVDIPDCSFIPPELWEKLVSKANDMNAIEFRVKFVVSSDTTVSLFGRAEEVDQLKEVISQFVLDQVSIRGKITLPFPELLQDLPDLLQLHNIDLAGVTFHPVSSSAKPTLELEGPSSKVNEVKSRVNSFLYSLVQNKVIIKLPGAVRYFESVSGKQSMSQVARSHKSLIHLEERLHSHRQDLGVARYRLQDDLEVLVCEGDITKQYADALVNAANKYLDHGGGVAAALSKAGGPQVQKECKDIIKTKGKLTVGEVVVTTGGNLKCKKLLHAVGPKAEKHGGKERLLLEHTVKNVLDLAESMNLGSIAMPCISSGRFGVPIAVCSEAIVNAVREFGSQDGRSLRKIILIDVKGDVVKAMQSACDRLLRGAGESRETGLGAAGGDVGSAVHVEIVQGNIETQKVDALVSPMLGHDPRSTGIGKILSGLTGLEMTTKFKQTAKRTTQPGETVLLENLPALKCKAVSFLNQIRWDNNKKGNAVQVLRHGIRQILSSCDSRGYNSVALPVLGTGNALGFPHSVASLVLLEEISAFEHSRQSTSSFSVKIVIHPIDNESKKAFQSHQDSFQFKGLFEDAAHDVFYQPISSTDEKVTAMVGGVELQIICGNLLQTMADVIVNTTDFPKHKSAGMPTDLMCSTGPGLLGCKEIIHASFKNDTELIRKKCQKILQDCDTKGYTSVAFPAVNTGVAGMDPAKACRAMLDGIAAALQHQKPNSLVLVCIVIIQKEIFEAFRSELQKRFGQNFKPHRNAKERAVHKVKKRLHMKRSKSLSASEPKFLVSPELHPVVFTVISLGSDVIKNIKTDLESTLQKNLFESKVVVQNFSWLGDMELDAVRAKMAIYGISVELQKNQRLETTGDRSQKSDEQVYVLKGLKEDVLCVTDLINSSVQQALHQELQEKEEYEVFLIVQWSIKNLQDVWEELSPSNNYKLEKAHQSGEVSVEISALDRELKVNMTKQEATDWKTGITFELKRVEPTSALELPEHWDPMDGEVFKKVELNPNSTEYIKVAKGFRDTAKFTIQKIERVQNSHLWQAFEVSRDRLIAKNGKDEVGEKFLYHGTSAESCRCIERDKFDRGYAGKHATAYGRGVYFALNADYSAKEFSPADPSGLKRLYVARVLTGRYALGKSSYVSPPPRGSDPTDRFDSVVDNLQSPTKFVIFHDDQAYPEYLITFK